MVEHSHLYPPALLLLDCDQRSFPDGCGCVLYCLHYPPLRVEGCGEEVCYAADGKVVDEDSGGDNTDIPNPNSMGCSNTSSSHSDKGYPNNSTDRSNHSTNHTKVPQ